MSNLKQQTISGVKWATITHWSGFLLKKLISRERTYPILAYHRITAGETSDKHAVSAKDFAQQINYLYERGFRTISLSDYTTSVIARSAEGARAERSESSPKGTKQSHSFILTFDDGFEDFYTNALPILKKYNFTATVFIVAGLAGKESEWERAHGRQPSRLMDWTQIKDIIEQGMEIGSHTMTHADLTKLSENTLDYEIGQSKRILETQTKHKIEFLAYPYGKCTEKARKVAKNNGYLGALTTTECAYNDGFTLGRIYVTNGDLATKIYNKVRLCG